MLSSGIVTLRAVEPSDAEFMYDMENDPECWRYGETIAPLSRHIIRDYALNYDADPISARQLRLIIIDSSTQAPVGAVDLYDIDPVNRRAFIGIYILASHRNKGYASAAVGLVADYAYHSLHLRLLAVRVEHTNFISLRLFESLGFVRRGLIPDWFSLPDGSYSDLILLSRLLPFTQQTV